MGMDVYGRAPRNETGRYFRNNVWWWRPLADYACEIAPEITAPCKYWQSNDGDGLDEAGAIALADALQSQIDAGKTERYAKIYNSRNEMLANIECQLCAGTGVRLPVPHAGAGDLKHGGIRCNACDGSGHVRPDETYYPFNTENVVQFVAFLRDCGGFEIC